MRGERKTNRPETRGEGRQTRQRRGEGKIERRNKRGEEREGRGEKGKRRGREDACKKHAKCVKGGSHAGKCVTRLARAKEHKRERSEMKAKQRKLLKNNGNYERY